MHDLYGICRACRIPYGRGRLAGKYDVRCLLICQTRKCKDAGRMIMGGVVQQLSRDILVERQAIIVDAVHRGGW